MLFVLALCGYPIDGLTQSAVLAAQEVLRDNKFVVAGYTTVAVAVMLLVWTCAAYRAMRSARRREHDEFACSHSQRMLKHAELPNTMSVDPGGR